MSIRSCRHRLRPTGLGMAMAAVIALVLFHGLSAAAEPVKPAVKEKPIPIRITADKLVTDNVSRTAVFSGKVTAEQEETKLTADELKIFYAAKSGDAPTGDASTGDSNIERIEARGNVRILFDNKLAVSNQAVYIIEKRELYLEGPDTKVVSGEDEITGRKITVNRNTGHMVLEGDGQSRVKAVIHSDQRGLK